MTLHLNSTVVSRLDASLVGTLKRIKKGMAYVMPDGAKEPLKLPIADLIAVKKLRPAKASAPSGDKKDNVINQDLTSKIQLKIRGIVRPGSTWEVISRSFLSTKEAQQYLKTFKLIDIDRHHAKLSAPLDAEVMANYDIKKILDGEAPKDLLPVLIDEASSERTSTKTVSVTPVKPINGTAAHVPTAKPSTSRGVVKSDLIPLKTICRDLDIEPREARMKLRSLAKSKKLSHDPQGRWEWPADQVDDIKKQLGGSSPEPVKEAHAKAETAKKTLHERAATPKATAKKTPAKPAKKAVVTKRAKK